MRRIIFLVALVIILAGCETTPKVAPDALADNTSAIIDTQATIASDAATVAAGAAKSADEAQIIADAVSPSAQPVVKEIITQHVETTKRLEADAKKLQADADAARKEVITTLEEKSVAITAYVTEKDKYQAEVVKHGKTKSQRNTLAAILAAIVAGAVVWVLRKLKLVRFPPWISN